jgi:alpha-aminoadipate carrier protein LysW
MKQNNQKISCPDCGTEVKSENDLMVGDILECQECGTEVEILSLDPLKYQTLVEEK